MRVVIFEDERPALDHLRASLVRCEPGVEIAAAVMTVRDAVEWLRVNAAPDLILADIELSDGQSLQVFGQVDVACPVIFCTAYDEYITEAFRCNGIDYLLKPIEDDELATALSRYRQLERHFAGQFGELARALEIAPRRHRQRLLCRRGQEMVAVSIEKLAYLEVEGGVSVAVTRDGQRWWVDRPLGEIQAELDPSSFFRVNRQVLAGAAAVRGFCPHVKGRLLVTLDPTGLEVVVSQPNARRFRDWLDS